MLIEKLTSRAQDAEDLGASDGVDLGDTVAITKVDTDGGGSHTLLGELDDVLLDLLGLSLEPSGGGPTIGQRGAGNTLTVMLGKTYQEVSHHPHRN